MKLLLRVHPIKYNFLPVSPQSIEMIVLFMCSIVVNFVNATVASSSKVQNITLIMKNASNIPKPQE